MGVLTCDFQRSTPETRRRSYASYQYAGLEKQFNTFRDLKQFQNMNRRWQLMDLSRKNMVNCGTSELSAEVQPSGLTETDLLFDIPHHSLVLPYPSRMQRNSYPSGWPDLRSFQNFVGCSWYLWAWLVLSFWVLCLVSRRFHIFKPNCGQLNFHSFVGWYNSILVCSAAKIKSTTVWVA